MENPKVYIIILNYNNWWDTIECLESIFKNNYTNYQVVVVDNNSQNDSLKYIKAWAEGKLNVWVSPANILRKFSNPPVKKPINFIVIDENLKGIDVKSLKEKQLIIIKNFCNKGFSGGVNTGIKLVLILDNTGSNKSSKKSFIWILNNDTVIPPHAIKSLVNFSLEREKSLIGVKLMFYDSPYKIQAFGGGKILKYLGLNFNLKKEVMITEQHLDYISGASIFLSKKNFLEIGFFDEEFFLSWEDIDYSQRALKKGYNLEVCPIKIYHKETVSIGKRSELDIYNRTKGSIIFTRKHYPKGLMFVILLHFLKNIKYIKNIDLIKANVKAIIHALKKKRKV